MTEKPSRKLSKEQNRSQSGRTDLVSIYFGSFYCLYFFSFVLISCNCLPFKMSSKLKSALLDFLKESCKRKSDESIFDFCHDMTSLFSVSKCLLEHYHDCLFSITQITLSLRKSEVNWHFRSVKPVRKKVTVGGNETKVILVRIRLHLIPFL